MVSIHPQGKRLLFNMLTWLVLFNLILYFLSVPNLILIFTTIASIGFYSFLIFFFRNPERKPFPDENNVYSPADGKIVIIEEIHETDFFNKRMMKISVFMSPMDVHVNRVPFSGIVTESRYYEGDYLVAWHPKSSTHNERHSTVIEKPNGIKILITQIAGAVARRVVCFAQPGMQVKQGDELGIIKFGSRVDIVLPMDTTIKVQLGEMVKAGITVIARF